VVPHALVESKLQATAWTPGDPPPERTWSASVCIAMRDRCTPPIEARRWLGDQPVRALPWRARMSAWRVREFAASGTAVRSRMKKRPPTKPRRPVRDLDRELVRVRGGSDTLDDFVDPRY
jgi:hypothetical protein